MLKLLGSPSKCSTVRSVRFLWVSADALQGISRDGRNTADLARSREFTRLHSSFARGPGKWEQRRDMELPAIIGRELLVQGAAQEVMDLRKIYGQDMEAYLRQPIAAFLPAPTSSPEKEESPSERSQQTPATNEESTSAAAEEVDDNSAEEPAELLFAMKLATKRTYQPSTIIRKRRHGFLTRLRSVGGRRVLKRRRLRGRRKMTA